MSVIITIVQQNGSQFAPHPLLPHAKACYYSRIILNSLPLLLFSKLFRHNYLRPSPKASFHELQNVENQWLTPYGPGHTYREEVKCEYYYLNFADAYNTLDL